MPFCNSCAIFEPKLDHFGLCIKCSTLFLEGKITESAIKHRNKMIEKNVNWNQLHYPETLDQKISPSPFPNNQNRSILDTLIAQDGASNQSETGFIEGRRVQGHHYRRSSLALSTALLGFILIFIPQIAIGGLILITSGMIMAISARRTEGRNWRQLAAIGISILFWILLIIGIIMLMDDPSLIDQYTTEIYAT